MVIPFKDQSYAHQENALDKVDQSVCDCQYASGSLFTSRDDIRANHLCWTAHLD
jgi:hypothetical protein